MQEVLALEGPEDMDEDDVAGPLGTRGTGKEGPGPVKRRRLDSAYSGLGDPEDEDEDQVPTASRGPGDRQDGGKKWSGQDRQSA